jgi:hypothetical protein
MLDMQIVTRCAYEDCRADDRLSTLIIERDGGRLERRVCSRHLGLVPIITEQLAGLAYRLTPFRPLSEPAPAETGVGGSVR